MKSLAGIKPLVVISLDFWEIQTPSLSPGTSEENVLSSMCTVNAGLTKMLAVVHCAGVDVRIEAS
jgi:hypothetical protein